MFKHVAYRHTGYTYYTCTPLLKHVVYSHTGYTCCLNILHILHMHGSHVAHDPPMYLKCAWPVSLNNKYGGICVPYPAETCFEKLLMVCPRAPLRVTPVLTASSSCWKSFEPLACMPTHSIPVELPRSFSFTPHWGAPSNSVRSHGSLQCHTALLGTHMW